MGYVDRQSDGSFLACDMYSRNVGLFADLRAAMAAISEANAAEQAGESSPSGVEAGTWEQ